MSYVTIPSYEGNSPFIYVYYAEEDTRLALPVLTRLYNEGLRMWSWSGCANPTDIRASQRISSCSALLIFLSENLDRDIQRGYFEAMEALRCNKVKYFVRLSDVELPFDWGKSDANVVIDYVRSNEAAFWLSIYDSEIIEGCRGAWPTKKVTAGMSAFDAIDSSELSDEYSNILKIIGDSPALDRSGVPINAEDIALFAGAGEPDEKQPEPDNAAEPQVDDLNRRSMEDLFGMLDEISVSTRQKADELRQAAEKRRADQEKAALSRASLPFQQDVVAVEHPDEPPVPALSFIPSALTVEDIAAEMFGLHISELAPIEAEPQEEVVPEAEITPELEVIPEPEESPAPSFEEFIDELTDSGKAEDPAPEAEKIPEVPEEPVHMATHPITVEITEESTSPLLPPAGGSLTDFTLPDDNYMTTYFVVNDDENDILPTAAERAAAAEESRKQFESALEKAAYKVSGRIVARHSKGLHSVGLRVRKPKTLKLSVQARVKAEKEPEKEPVRVSPIPVAKDIPKEEETDRALSRAERRARRHKKGAEPIAETPAETQEVRRLSVTPEPMRGEMPSSLKPTEPPVEIAAPIEENTKNPENTPTPRKKRHPHNSSGLLDMLRALRSQSSPRKDEDNE